MGIILKLSRIVLIRKSSYSEVMFTLDDVSVMLGNNLALDQCSLEFGTGELVALIGANGAGKSTLLRMLGNFLEPSSGTLTRQTKNVAYVAQHHDHLCWMPVTVDEVLKMGRYRKLGLFGRFRPGDKAAIDSAADRLGVTDLRRRTFGELSGGQQQRVFIASALASGSDCLLLDEPITGLDLPSQQIILDVAKAERDDGRLVIMSTHHLEEASICDRVVVLASRVVIDAPPEQALQPEPLIEAFGQRVVQVPGAAHTEPLILLDDHGHTHGHSHPNVPAHDHGHEDAVA